MKFGDRTALAGSALGPRFAGAGHRLVEDLKGRRLLVRLANGTRWRLDLAILNAAGLIWHIRRAQLSLRYFKCWAAWEEQSRR